MADHADPPLRLIVSAKPGCHRIASPFASRQRDDRQAMIVNEAFALAWIGALKREPDNQRMWADL
jgi:hypothetical protein